MTKRERLIPLFVGAAWMLMVAIPVAVMFVGIAMLTRDDNTKSQMVLYWACVVVGAASTAIVVLFTFCQLGTLVDRYWSRQDRQPPPSLPGEC